jgi:hypothetical protein
MAKFRLTPGGEPKFLADESSEEMIFLGSEILNGCSELAAWRRRAEFSGYRRHISWPIT